MKWSGEYTVNANDIDVNRVVTASQILRYMQDAANWQMETDGLSYDELFVNRGLAFVLSKIKVSMYAPITSHQRITVESWACPSRGMTFQRCYRILRDGCIVAEAI
ncbi:MAG: acyl-CoA thioesterase, partial [Clostridia bacterium]|nr:acyl-CoA thioesterase [Clostridia bacterium]